MSAHYSIENRLHMMDLMLELFYKSEDEYPKK